MKSLLLLLLVGIATADLHREEFDKFKSEFGKTYKTVAEEEERFAIFKNNLKDVTNHNKHASTYTRGVTQFSDLTTEEFKSTYLGRKKIGLPTSATKQQKSPANKEQDLPNSVNWVEAGVITDVKNQGQCGSCWAFALTAQVESYAKIATDTLLELSTQQVTSCTPNPLQCGGTGGCMGSIENLGFNYLQLFGQVKEEDYPYVSGTTTNDEDCIYDLENIPPVVGLTGYDTLPLNDGAAVMKHIAEVGPLAIGVDATNWSSYTGGVYDGCSFDENISINHAVQLVGYGSDFGPLGVYDYWLVRNSWGSRWGEDGYIRLLRTDQCGMDYTPLDGSACVGGPGSDQSTVCGMCGMYSGSSFPLGVHLL